MLRLAVVAMMVADAGASEVPSGAKLRMLVLPSRASQGMLEARVGPLAAALAAKLNTPTEAPVAHNVELDLATALHSSGGIEAAPARLDRLIARGLGGLPQLSNPPELLSAQVARAAIALARGESAPATRLIERILRFDPAFTLSPSENSPRLAAAFAEARGRLGRQPPLDAEDIAAHCQGVSDLVVLRALADGTAEALRFHDCRWQANAAFDSATSDAAIATLLAHESAARPARPVAESDEAVARAHFQAGQGLYRLGKFDEAARQFDAGYQRVPKPEFLLNLGQAYRALGELSRAREYYVRFLERAPADHPTRQDVAQLVTELGRSGRAKAALAPAPAPIAQPATPPIHRASRRPLLWSVVALGLAGVAAGVAVGVGYMVTQPPSASLGHYQLP